MSEPTRHPVPILIGTHRSGTALLRAMLDAHPDIAVPYEAAFIAPLIEQMEDPENNEPLDCWRLVGHMVLSPAWDDFELDPMDLFRALRGDASLSNIIRRFGDAYASRLRKHRFGLRDPESADIMHTLSKHLPEAHFIHVIRDGRAVVSSLLSNWCRPSNEAGELARYWADTTSRIRHSGESLPHYYEVYYEDLINDTESCLTALCNDLELPFDRAMLEYYRSAPARLEELHDRQQGDRMILKEDLLQLHDHLALPPDTERIHAWRQELNKDQLEEILTAAKPVLKQFQYC